MHKMLNVNDYFRVAMRSGKMHSECGGPDPMWRQIPPGLTEHIDGLRSTCPKPRRPGPWFAMFHGAIRLSGWPRSDQRCLVIVESCAAHDKSLDRIRRGDGLTTALPVIVAEGINWQTTPYRFSLFRYFAKQLLAELQA